VSIRRELWSGITYRSGARLECRTEHLPEQSNGLTPNPSRVHQSQAVPPTTPEAAAHPARQSRAKILDRRRRVGVPRSPPKPHPLPKASVGTSQTPGTNISPCEEQTITVAKSRSRAAPGVSASGGGAHACKARVVLRLSVVARGPIAFGKREQVFQEKTPWIMPRCRRYE